MAIFEIQGPDGAIYEVDAPDEASALSAFQGFVGSQPQQPSPDVSAALAGSGPMPPPRADGQYSPADMAAINAAMPADPMSQPQSWGDMAIDVLGAGAAGLGRGVMGLAGLPGTVSDLADRGLMAAGKGIGIIPDEWQSPPQSPLSSQAIMGAASDLTGGATDYRGESIPARLVGSAAEFLPGAASFGGVSPNNLIRYGAFPGVASEAAGMATEGTWAEPYARIAAALLAAPAANLAEKGIRRAISPNAGADAGRLALANVLDDAGVPVSAGQRVGNEALRRREGMTGAGQALNDTQREALTRAALRTVGEDASRATPEVLSRAASRIGDVFDDVVRGVDVTPDPSAVTRLSEAVRTYKDLAPTSGQAPIIGNIFRETTNAMRGGNTIPASTLKVWRSRLSSLTASGDTATRTAAIEALETVDDMMSGALTSMGRADDVARLATARDQWRNLLAVQQAATGAGEAAAAGILSPSGLRNAVTSQGRAAYAQGRRGDLGELARAAEGVIKPLPTSGTAENLKAMGLSSGIWGGIGAGAGAATPIGPVAGAIAAQSVPAIAGAARMSGPMQRYLANQWAGRGGPVLPAQSLSPVAAALAGYDQQ